MVADDAGGDRGRSNKKLEGTLKVDKAVTNEDKATSPAQTPPMRACNSSCLMSYTFDKACTKVWAHCIFSITTACAEGQ